MYLMPYNFHKLRVGSRYFLRSKKAPLMGHDCWLIRIENTEHRLSSNLWIDPKTAQVIQVETTDLSTNDVYTATYLSFFAADKDTGYSMYSRVKVEYNNYPVCLVELTEPKINSLTSKDRFQQISGSDERYKRIRSAQQFISEEVAPFLSENMLNLVILLCIALAVLGLRYISFAMSRQEFCDELLVIDEENGRFTELLNKLGYKVIPFSAEVLTAEREILGKGSTKDTITRPRSLVVAPESFSEVKNYLFLIKAYVEEGGRVLVMYHSPKSTSYLPFEPELLPLPLNNANISFEYDTMVLTGLPEDGIKRVTAAYTARETYLSINHKPMKRQLITAVNRVTGVKSVVVGSTRHRKGEYIVCQIEFNANQTLRSKPMQILLNDLLRYVLGLMPIPHEDEPYAS